jgi:hypothetical protein
MARVTIRDLGRAPGPVSWETLERILETLWGPQARSLPGYPQVAGAIHAHWFDEQNTQYTVQTLDELAEAYRTYRTARIVISGKIGDGPRCHFDYWPAQAVMSVEVQAGDKETAERLIAEVRTDFPLTTFVIFISHSGETDRDVALYLKKLLESRLGTTAIVFVAPPDIQKGANWHEVLHDQIFSSKALIVICSRNSWGSPWIWWEAGAAWGREILTIPLFVGISPSQFGGPIGTYLQGATFSNPSEVNDLIRRIFAEAAPNRAYNDLSPTELDEFEQVKARHTS